MDARRPNLFIVGAAKSGTTALYTLLGQHPDVFMSRNKEPHFFSDVRPRPEQRAFMDVVSADNEYRRLFAGAAGHKIIGEASPSYLWDPRAAQKIRAYSPDAKIIIMLRDPIERAYSHYLMDVRYGMQTRTFYDALRDDQSASEKGWGVSHLYVELGMYAQQVGRYLDIFGKGNVLLLFFDHWKERTAQEMCKVFTFLSLDGNVAIDAPGEGSVGRYGFMVPRNGWATRLLASNAIRTLGKTLLPPRVRQQMRDGLLFRPGAKPTMDGKAIAYLRECYRVDEEQLSRLIGYSLPWKNSSATEPAKQVQG